jgi:mRNA interferase RelE/StbE
MAYRVLLRRSAARELSALPQPMRVRVTQIIARLANNPRPPGAKLLRSADGRWRVRVGDYRVLYQVDDDRVVVLVVRVRHRSIAYRSR